MGNTRRIVIALAFASILIPAAACQKNGTNASSSGSTTSVSASAGDAANLSPEELGKIGAAISRNPAEAKKILGDRGLTEESFEQAVRKVSADPAASRKYRDGFRSARA